MKNREILFPGGNLSGTFNVPERAIPDTANYFYFEFLRCTDIAPTIWPDPATMLEDRSRDRRTAARRGCQQEVSRQAAALC